MRVSALLVGTLHNSQTVALVAFSIASAMGYAGYTVAVGMAVNLSLRDMARVVWKPGLLAGACLAISMIVPGDMYAVRYATVVLLAGVWAWFVLRAGLRG